MDSICTRIETSLGCNGLSYDGDKLFKACNDEVFSICKCDVVVCVEGLGDDEWERDDEDTDLISSKHGLELEVASISFEKFLDFLASR